MILFRLGYVYSVQDLSFFPLSFDILCILYSVHTLFISLKNLNAVSFEKDLDRHTAYMYHTE